MQEKAVPGCPYPQQIAHSLWAGKSGKNIEHEVTDQLVSSVPRIQ